MTDNIIDIRRFFRNRFEYYMDKKDSHGADVRDNAPVTLRNLCQILAEDREPFPRRYDPDVRKICGHEYPTYFKVERTYGDVARLIGRLLAAEDGEMPPVGARWVHAVLKSGQTGAAS